jgi:hypothetical protein
LVLRFIFFIFSIGGTGEEETPNQSSFKLSKGPLTFNRNTCAKRIHLKALNSSISVLSWLQQCNHLTTKHSVLRESGTQRLIRFVQNIVLTQFFFQFNWFVGIFCITYLFHHLSFTCRYWIWLMHERVLFIYQM